MTCPATTTGPRAWPCTRPDPHDRGHVFEGEPADTAHEDEGIGW